MNTRNEGTSCMHVKLGILDLHSNYLIFILKEYTVFSLQTSRKGIVCSIELNV